MEIHILFTAIIFLSVILLSSRYFYFSELKSFAKRTAKSLDLDMSQLNYSFEQMVYFVSLPSNIPLIKQAQIEDIVIRFDYGSLLFPRISGIHVCIETDAEKMSLAYLPLKDFRLPTLDKMFEQGKIDQHDYLKLSASKLLEWKTLAEITAEVYKQIQRNRDDAAVS